MQYTNYESKKQARPRIVKCELPKAIILQMEKDLNVVSLIFKQKPIIFK